MRASNLPGHFRWSNVGKILTIALLGAVLVGCEDDEPTPMDPMEPDPFPEIAAGYVGTDACGFCHGTLTNEFKKSAHPYKIRKVENGQAPIYPFSDVPAPPAGYSWSDVSYVIGGFGWKARFIGLDGFIITDGGLNQWNLATEEWVDYHKDERKPFDCGRCHTTGYQPDGNQDGLPGLIGQWVAPGIQCEECHGPGKAHADSPGTRPLSIDTRASECGRCHNRGGLNDQIPASGGFIKHHEQYNELVASDHQFLTCVTCHDPHAGVVYSDLEGTNPIKVACEGCHTDARASLQAGALAGVKADFDCESCHMPYAAKSAVAMGTFVGDVRSHLVKINSAVDAEQFDGSLANHYLTLDFACLGCHDDEDRTWAAGGAPLVHEAGFAATRKKAAIQ